MKLTFKTKSILLFLDSSKRETTERYNSIRRYKNAQTSESVLDHMVLAHCNRATILRTKF